MTTRHPTHNGLSWKEGEHRSDPRPPLSAHAKNQLLKNVLVDPDHNTAPADRSNAEAPTRLPIPRAHIERAPPRKPSAQLTAKLTESGKTVVKTVTQVQDLLEGCANTLACLANENWRCLDTFRDDVATLLEIFEQCADKEEILRYARQILDPGVEPQQPVGALQEPEHYHLPSFADLQCECETASLKPDAGPTYIKNTSASLELLADARTRIHDLAVDAFVDAKATKPPGDPDQSKLGSDERLPYASTDLFKRVSSAPAKSQKRPADGHQGQQPQRGRGSPRGGRGRGRGPNNHGGGRGRQDFHGRPFHHNDQRGHQHRPQQHQPDQRAPQEGQSDPQAPPPNFDKGQGGNGHQGNTGYQGPPNNRGRGRGRGQGGR